MTVPRPELYAQAYGASAGSAGPPVAGSHGRGRQPRELAEAVATDSGRREIIRDLEQDMKIPARGPCHQPGAASAERAVHATGPMLADPGHLRAGLATEAAR